MYSSFVRALGFATIVLTLVSCRGEQESVPETPEARFEQLGGQVYGSYCVTCHQPSGQGLPGAFPPLSQTEWVLGDKGRLIRLILNGMQGPIQINGERYHNVMTNHGFLNDEQIAAVLTHVRNHFDNDADAVSASEVRRVRAANEKVGLWEAEELEVMTGIPETKSAGSSE